MGSALDSCTAGRCSERRCQVQLQPATCGRPALPMSTLNGPQRPELPAGRATDGPRGPSDHAPSHRGPIDRGPSGRVCHACSACLLYVHGAAVRCLCSSCVRRSCVFRSGLELSGLFRSFVSFARRLWTMLRILRPRNVPVIPFKKECLKRMS